MSDQRPTQKSVWRRWRPAGFVDAARGLKILVTTQPNACVHLGATGVVLGLSVWLRLSAGEWGAVMAVVAMVWVAEGMNTAIEFLVDIVSPEKQRLAGWAKDVAAGAVLAAALGAVAVGLVIFGPKMAARLGW